MPRKPKHTPESRMKDLIRKEIARQNRSLRETAKCAGLTHHQALLRWLNGDRGIKAEYLASVLDCLGIELTTTR